MRYDKAKMSAASIAVGLLVIASASLAGGQTAPVGACAADDTPSPVRMCLDAMQAECNRLGGDVTACMDLMRPICDTAYLESPPGIGGGKNLPQGDAND